MQTDLLPAHRAFLLVCETKGILTDRNPIPESAVIAALCLNARAEAVAVLENGSPHQVKESFPNVSALADALLAVDSAAALGRFTFRRILTHAQAWKDLTT